MAIATLERLGNLLTEIKNISLGVMPGNRPINSNGEIQHIKYKMVKQFFVQSVPLLKDADEKIILSRLNKIKPIYVNYMQKSNNKLGFTKVGDIPYYSEVIENALDDILIKIQNFLQRDGFFMPPKHDPRAAWKQG